MKASPKRIFRDSLIYTILPKISIFVNLLITPIISPYLTLNDFGTYGLIIAYLGIFQMLVILGLNVVLQNSFFEYGSKYKLVWKRIFAIMMVSGAVCAVVFSGIIYLSMSAQLGHHWVTVCALISAYLIFSPIEIIAVNYYVLKERTVPYALCSAIVGAAAVLINLVAIKFFRLGYIGWIIVYPAAILIMYVYYFSRFFLQEKLYPVFRMKKRFIAASLKVGGPLIPHQLSLYVLGSSDRILLEYFGVRTAKIGYYSQGYNIGSYGSTFIGGVFQAMARKLQEGFRGNEPQHRKFIRSAMILTCMAVSGVLFIACLWMKQAFLFLYRKPELQKAYPVAIVVACSYMFWVVYTFFTYPLSIQKKTFSVSKISLVAAGANVVLNIFLIPRWGIWAALASTYFSYFLFGIAGIFNRENRQFLNRYIPITFFCLFSALGNILLFVIAYICMDATLGVKLSLSAGILLVFYLIYRKVIGNPRGIV